MRKCQKECIEEIKKYDERYENGVYMPDYDDYDEDYQEVCSKHSALIKMFCGTGKSRVECEKITDVYKSKNTTSCIVFPTIELLKQFDVDYISKVPEIKNKLLICSESDTHDKSYTTNVKDILKFTNEYVGKSKLYLVTYQSLDTLLAGISNIKIDCAIFDEGHHSVSDKYKELIYNNDRYINKYFFTATPRNLNGIVMHDYEEEYAIPSSCDMIYDYSYFSGVKDRILKPFEIRIDFYGGNSNKNLYETIARAILGSGNTRVLTFHSTVNSSETEEDKITAVKLFVNQKEFESAYETIRQTEFPNYLYKKIYFECIHAETKNKSALLNKFANTPDDEIFILSSCRTIGEGIDTKNANMCVFIDPKSSFTEITQNIGRIVRRDGENDKRVSTILIPCHVDRKKYENCQTIEERDAVIREDMSKTGDFSCILNVLSALKQEDEDLYKLCINYPAKLTDKEVQSKFKKGYRIFDDIHETTGKLDNALLLADVDINNINNIDFNRENIEILEELSKIEKIPITIYTNNRDCPVIHINAEEKSRDSIYLYKNECDEYYPILNNTNSIKKRKENTKRLGTSIHINEEFKVLWKISDTGLSLKSGLIECIVTKLKDNEERWHDTLKKVKEYIDKNEKRPSKGNIDEEIKKLGRWIIIQKTNYKNNERIMKQQDIRNKWEEFINDEKYREYFLENEEKWGNILEKVKNYINEYEEPPNRIDIDEETKINLGLWVCTQKKNYKNREYIMKQENIRNKWEEFINDEKYREYFLDNEEIWDNILKKVKEYIDENKKRPSKRNIDEETKILGDWLSKQKANYKIREYNMKQENIRNKWEEFINDEKYREHFLEGEEIWNNNLEKVTKYINEHGKIPNQGYIDGVNLGKWLTTQKATYKTPNNSLMKQQSIRNKWEEFVNDEKYKKFFPNFEVILLENKSYTDILLDLFAENNLPSSSSPTEKELIGILLENNIPIPSKYDKKTVSNLKQLCKDKNIPYKSTDAKQILIDKLNEFDNKSIICSEDIQKQPSPSVSSKYDKMTVANLRQLCKDKNISYKSRDTKQILIDKLNEFDQSTILSEEQTTNTNIPNDTTPSTDTLCTEQVVHQKPYDSMAYHSSSIKRDISLITDTDKTPKKKGFIDLLASYKNSSTKRLMEHFENKPTAWHNFHRLAKKQEEKYKNKELLPRNFIMNELSKQKYKRNIKIVDMGCGHADIAANFSNNTLFEFYNYDLIDIPEKNIKKKDIANLDNLDDSSVDICILSMALWGRNKKQYLKEAHRILDPHGILYLAEAVKPWVLSEEDSEPVKLHTLVSEVGFEFKRINDSSNKFVILKCIKV